MRKGLIFWGGFFVGAIVSILILVAIAYVYEKPQTIIPGAAIFDEPTEYFHANSFKVMQVVKDNAALVHSGSDPFSGQMFLLINHNNHFYYDDEVIRVPKGKTVRQMGIYRYTTNMGIDKTVPVIEILDY